MPPSRRLLVLLATLPLSVFALSLLAHNGDACHDPMHGCNDCPARASAPRACHSVRYKQVMTVAEVRGEAAMLLPYASAAALNASQVEPGDDGTLQVALADMAGQARSVQVTVEVNRTLGIVWEGKRVQSATLSGGNATLSFPFEVAGNATGTLEVDFTVRATGKEGTESRMGAFILEVAKPASALAASAPATSSPTTGSTSPAPGNKAAAPAAALVAVLLLALARRRTA